MRNPIIESRQTTRPRGQATNLGQSLLTHLMLKRSVRCLLLTGIVSVVTSTAYPWQQRSCVVAIAEIQLTDAACKRAKELLPQGTTVAEASTWPDKAGRQTSDRTPITM
jgi:hypothetical protein